MKYSLSVVALLLALLGGCRSACCAKPATTAAPLEVYAQKRTAPFTKFTVQEAAPAHAVPWVNRNCPNGEPSLSQSFGHGLSEIVYYPNFIAEVSLTEKIPLWVCERVTKGQLSGPGDRDNSGFRQDVHLKSAGQPRAKDRDYVHSGYDRGHQAPAANHKKSQEWMDNTHYFSNISPQDPDFNRFDKIWEELEGKTRGWIRSGRLTHAHIITGGFFYDPEEEDPQTADGIISYFTIGPGQVSVPTHFYKIVIGKDRDDVRQAVAFVFENREYPEPYVWKDHVRSVRWVEERAGINFMPDLNALESRNLEKDPVDLDSWPR